MSWIPGVSHHCSYVIPEPNTSPSLQPPGADVTSARVAENSSANDIKVTTEIKHVDKWLFFGHDERLTTITNNGQVLLTIRDPSIHRDSSSYEYRDADDKLLLEHEKYRNKVEGSEENLLRESNAASVKTVTVGHAKFSEGEFNALITDKMTDVQIRVEVDFKTGINSLKVQAYDPSHGVRLQLSDDGEFSAHLSGADHQAVPLPEPASSINQ